MFAQAILISLVPLLPVSAAIDPEDPGAPVQPTEEEALPPKAETPALEPDRRSAIYFTLGFGTPLGIVGIEGVHRLGSIFEISGGLGIGEAAASNLPPNSGPGPAVQWAVMPRLRLGDGRGAVTLGVGVSGGNFGDFLHLSCVTDCGSDPVTSQTISPISYFLWSNFELGREWWFGGFALRLFGGYAHGWCVSTPCLVSATANLPYLGFGLGYAF